MDYKKEIISMVEKMENEDFLCKAYYYILARFRKEKEVVDNE
mgnify:FL=1